MEVFINTKKQSNHYVYLLILNEFVEIYIVVSLGLHTNAMNELCNEH